MKRKRKEGGERKSEQRDAKVNKRNREDSPGKVVPSLPVEILHLLQRLCLEGPAQEPENAQQQHKNSSME